MVLRESKNLVPDGTGLDPKIASGKPGVSAGAVLAPGEQAMRVDGLRLPQITATFGLLHS